MRRRQPGLRRSRLPVTDLEKRSAGQGRIVMWNVRGQNERGLGGRLGR